MAHEEIDTKSMNDSISEEKIAVEESEKKSEHDIQENLSGEKETPNLNSSDVISEKEVH